MSLSAKKHDCPFCQCVELLRSLPNAPFKVEQKPVVEINYERGCFWHINCKESVHHSGIMREISNDDEAKRSVIRCFSCGDLGYYPYGSIGTVCSEPFQQELIKPAKDETQ